MKKIFSCGLQRLLALGISVALLLFGISGPLPGAVAEVYRAYSDLVGAWTVEGAGLPPGVVVFYEDGRMEFFQEEEGNLLFATEGMYRVEKEGGSFLTLYTGGDRYYIDFSDDGFYTRFTQIPSWEETYWRMTGVWTSKDGGLGPSEGQFTGGTWQSMETPDLWNMILYDDGLFTLWVDGDASSTKKGMYHAQGNLLSRYEEKYPIGGLFIEEGVITVPEGDLQGLTLTRTEPPACIPTLETLAGEWTIEDTTVLVFEGNTMRTANEDESAAMTVVLSGCWAVLEKKEPERLYYGAHLWITPEGQLKLTDFTGATVVYSRPEDDGSKDVAP